MSDLIIGKCPFCGAQGDMRNSMGEFWVWCPECGGTSSMKATAEDAIVAWNRRPQHHQPAAQVVCVWRWKHPYYYAERCGKIAKMLTTTCPECGRPVRVEGES